MPFKTKLSSLRRKLVRSLSAMLVLGSTILSAAPVWAADSDAAFRLTDSDQETYAQLVSGKKVQQQRDYEQPEQPTVYLTFDDGPSKLTPRVLDILKEEGVPATFFVLGQQAEEYPDTIKRIVQEGHAIGNHTYDHVYSELYGDFTEFWRQVRETDQILGDIAGVHPRLLRAPGGTAGNFDAFYFYWLDQAGYIVHDWNIDSGDSARPGVPAGEIYNTVKKGPFPHDVTLLMHDGSGHGETVRALPDIIKLFKDKGYAFASLTERVKPQQFGVSKINWQRGVPMAKFAKLLGQARAVAADRPEQATPAVPAVIKPPEPIYNNVPLKLQFRSGDAVLPPGGYELQQGTLRVPVRKLAERFGASIVWHEDKRMAAVHYGIRDVEYDLTAMTIRTYVFGRLDRIYPLADMKLVDGSILAPLRSTVALFGHEVSDYSMEANDRFVRIAPKTLAFFTEK
jgi:peptidoglycan/xylan/chitin deacetylase (PgdA/CDA1 family)